MKNPFHFIQPVNSTRYSFHFHEIRCCCCCRLLLSLFTLLLFCISFCFVFIFGLSTRTISLYSKLELFFYVLSTSISYIHSIPFGYSVSNCEFWIWILKEVEKRALIHRTPRTESFHRHFNSFNFFARLFNLLPAHHTWIECVCKQ